MFLIQYSKGKYINAESIQWVSLENSVVKFTVNGAIGDMFTVNPEYTLTFLNNLQALNCNIDSVEASYKRISGE